MHWSTDPIWTALAGMRIEPEGAALGFAVRLARENGWSADHAASVVEEYRRFLYLAATAGSPMTPSEDVDQAWHLHLAYSRHYWDVLCAQILKRPPHHAPTEGGAVAAGRFRRQYEATLTHYRAVFGADPPSAVWPDTEERFTVRPLRIDAARYWLVPKAPTRRTSALALVAATAAACTAAAARDAGNEGGSITSFLGGLIFAALVPLIVIGVIRTSNGRGRDRQDGSSGCSGGGCGSDGNSDGGSGCGGGCGGD